MTTRDTYVAHLETLGVDPGTLTVDASGTLVSYGAAPAPLRAAPALPLLRTRDTEGAPADVRVSKVLGEGGMGRVVAAEQVCLGREVAVKVLHADPDARSTDALLREALIAGRLEHPNVVPVYLVGRSDEGAPMFVMRRIEGVAWAEVLRDVSRAPGMFSGVRDPLAFHLEVFMEVCGAVQFAHSKGILHRDLKPDNVMLGAYREVYVVDWGLAVTLADDPLLPRAATARAIVGTPAYMAPEMASGDASALSPRTDVYLLGAVLCELLTGDAPHAIGTLMQCLGHAYLGELPDFPDTLPSDLVAVCRQAMHRDPASRYASADELRRAVEECVRHRSSWALSREADQRARALLDNLHGEGRPSSPSSPMLQDLFTECRFGYRQALVAWEGNTAAREGLQRALEAMIGYEIARENVRVASELMAQLPTPSEALTARLADARRALAERERRVADLERFRENADVTLGAAKRNRAGSLAGAVWAVASFGVGWGQRRGLWHFGVREGLLTSVAFAVTCTVLVLWLRRNTPMNDIQRRFMVLIVSCAWGFNTHWLLCLTLGVSLHAALSLYLIWVSGGWLVAATLYDRRLAGGGLAIGAGAIATALLPAWGFEVFGVTMLVAYLLVVAPPRWLVGDGLLTGDRGLSSPR